MKLSQEEKKAQLMAWLEKAADELLDWEEQNTKLTLTQLDAHFGDVDHRKRSMAISGDGNTLATGLHLK